MLKTVKITGKEDFYNEEDCIIFYKNHLDSGLKEIAKILDKFGIDIIEYEGWSDYILQFKKK